MTKSSLALVLALSLAPALASGTAAAQDGASALGAARSAPEGQEVDDATRAAGRRLGYEGVTAFNAGDYATASERLERAYAILKVPSVGLWSARSLAKVGRLVAASERYLEVARLAVPGVESEVHRKAQADARVEQAALVARLGHLVITVSPSMPADGSVTLDGAALPAAVLGTDLPVDPGTRHIELRRGGHATTLDVVLAEGESRRAEITAESNAEMVTPPIATPAPPPTTPSPPPEPASRAPSTHGDGTLRTVGWITVGVGAASVLMGAIVGGVAVGENSSLNGVCTGNVCPASSSSDVNTYVRNREIATVGLWVGGGLLAAGGVLLVIAPKRPDGGAVSAWIGPRGAGVEWRY